MQLKSKLSILGLYEWDNTVLTGLQLPEGYSADTLRDTILLECAELEVIYPNPDFCKRAVSLWASSRKPAWERMAKALDSEYNPVHNFDRHEDYTDHSEANVTNTPGTTSTTNVSSFNSAEPVPRESVQLSGTDTGNQTGDLEHKGHLYGNIGVTKTQEMISDELSLRKTDLYRIIADEFRERFCIMIY